MIPFAIAASRLAPLICLLHIQPLWVWPAPALALILSQGVATALLFCVQHSGIQNVRLAEHIDPKYALAVRQAAVPVVLGSNPTVAVYGRCFLRPEWN